MVQKLLRCGLAATFIGIILLAVGCAGGASDTAKAPAAAQAVKPAAQQTPVAAAKAPAGVPVLMYHKISDEKNNDAVISRERFEEQMAFLKRSGYHTLTLDELDAYLSGRQELPERPVVLTFDDGYRDTYEIAMPVLKSHGFKSTLFVLVGEADRHLTWEELREMKAAGMEVASHGITHRELASLSPAEQLAEIVRSKEILDRQLGQDTKHFCYPNGSFNETTLKVLREKGFRVAVTINPGWVKRVDDPLTLRRVWMGNSVDIRHFEERLTKADYSIL